MTAAREEFSIQTFSVLPSTNDSILEAGERGAPEGTAHIARAQTQGRGRAGRSWSSPPDGGLWMSVLLTPKRPRDLWGGIALIAGTAARRALLDLGARGVELCWPNDLKVGSRKLGGILAEVRTRAERAWMALGIGVNTDFTRPDVKALLPPEIRRLAISLAECGPPSTTDPVAVGRAILRDVWALYQEFESGTGVKDLVEPSLAHAGRLVTVKVPGRVAWRGAVRGLGPRGELLLEIAAEDEALWRAEPPPGAAWHTERRLAALTAGEVTYEEG